MICGHFLREPPSMSRLWHIFGFAAAVLLFLLLVLSCVLPHQVDGFYLRAPDSDGVRVCVYTRITWAPDQKSFCSDNVSEAFLVLGGLTKGREAAEHSELPDLKAKKQ